MEDRPFSQQIRDAVDSSGMSRYAICNAIGLTQGAMSRFMAGKAGLSLEILDRLAPVIGIEIKIKRSTKKTGDD
jgi:transcriptional regulator with XRE-family HTH domain